MMVLGVAGSLFSSAATQSYGASPSQRFRPYTTSCVVRSFRVSGTVLRNLYGLSAENQVGVATFQPERDGMSISVIVLTAPRFAIETVTNFRNAHVKTSETLVA